MLILLFIALSPLAVNAEILTFQGPETWSTWRAPIGLTQVGDEGQLQLTKFRRNINAVADAHEFTYESKSRGEVAGGLWEALSNPGTGAHIKAAQASRDFAEYRDICMMIAFSACVCGGRFGQPMTARQGSSAHATESPVNR